MDTLVEEQRRMSEQLNILREVFTTEFSQTRTELTEALRSTSPRGSLHNGDETSSAENVEAVSVLFQYVKYRLALRFCTHSQCVVLYIRTLENDVYNESILVDGAMAMTGNDREKAVAFLQSQVVPLHSADSTTAVRLRKRLSEKSVKKKVSTVAREAAAAQSRLHESLKTRAVRRCIYRPCYPSLTLCPRRMTSLDLPPPSNYFVSLHLSFPLLFLLSLPACSVPQRIAAKQSDTWTFQTEDAHR